MCSLNSTQVRLTDLWLVMQTSASETICGVGSIKWIQINNKVQRDVSDKQFNQIDDVPHKKVQADQTKLMKIKCR